MESRETLPEIPRVVPSRSPPAADTLFPIIFQVSPSPWVKLMIIFGVGIYLQNPLFVGFKTGAVLFLKVFPLPCVKTSSPHSRKSGIIAKLSGAMLPVYDDPHEIISYHIRGAFNPKPAPIRFPSKLDISEPGVPPNTSVSANPSR